MINIYQLQCKSNGSNITYEHEQDKMLLI
uniref:Uncharacterized protein n=1 Tax=Arundo donax TaxID=35708 RepID=A0A0A9B6T7_ARUDO